MTSNQRSPHQRRHRALGGFAVMCTLLPALAGLGSPAHADQQRPAPTAVEASLPIVNDGPVQSSQDAQMTDGAALAEMWHVSTDEAVRILALQELVDQIDFAHLDPDYAGNASTPGPQFSIAYYTTGDRMPARVEGLVRRAGLGELLRVQHVPFTPEELSEAQQAFKAAHPSLPADTWTDVATGMLHVESTSPAPTDVGLAAAPTGGVPIGWDRVTELATPTVAGGMPITVEGRSCTAGFVVAHETTGNKGIATAGHCGDDDGTYAGYYMYYQARGFGGNADVEWLDNPDVTWAARFKWNGTDLRDVTSRKWRSGMDVGDGVCKYGRTTGYKCGGVTRTNYCPSYVPSCLDTFLLVENNDGVDISERGDSGGPVFLGEQAWGFNSGQQGTGSEPQAVVMPQQFVGNLNMEVALAS